RRRTGDFDRREVTAVVMPGLVAAGSAVATGHCPAWSFPSPLANRLREDQTGGTTLRRCPMSGSSAMVMPLLARGRHRNPRRGACFMELVSYLAGETWSDSPECTDESLAHLARMVNDFSSDADRPQL